MSEEIKLPENLPLSSAVSALSMAVQAIGCRPPQQKFLDAISGDKSDIESFKALCALAEEKRLEIPAILAQAAAEKATKKTSPISGAQAPG